MSNKGKTKEEKIMEMEKPKSQIKEPEKKLYTLERVDVKTLDYIEGKFIDTNGFLKRAAEHFFEYTKKNEPKLLEKIKVKKTVKHYAEGPLFSGILTEKGGYFYHKKYRKFEEKSKIFKLFDGTVKTENKMVISVVSENEKEKKFKIEIGWILFTFGGENNYSPKEAYEILDGVGFFEKEKSKSKPQGKPDSKTSSKFNNMREFTYIGVYRTLDHQKALINARVKREKLKTQLLKANARVVVGQYETKAGTVYVVYIAPKPNTTLSPNRSRVQGFKGKRTTKITH